jgi:hypothetical protein
LPRLEERVPRKLSKQIQIRKRNPEVGLAFSGVAEAEMEGNFDRPLHPASNENIKQKLETLRLQINSLYTFAPEHEEP